MTQSPRRPDGRADDSAFCCLARSPGATREAARRLAEALPAEGLVVELAGPLGAGKTTFVKGLAAGLGLAADAVASPTFVIAHEHALPGGAARRLVHVDGYRLADEDELEAAGWSDWLVPGTLVVVEWGDRFPEALPADRLRVALGRRDEAGSSAPAPEPGAPEPGALEGGRSRRIAVSATGPRSASAAAGWREALARASIRDLVGP